MLKPNGYCQLLLTSEPKGINWPSALTEVKLSLPKTNELVALILIEPNGAFITPFWFTTPAFKVNEPTADKGVASVFLPNIVNWLSGLVKENEYSVRLVGYNWLAFIVRSAAVSKAPVIVLSVSIA